MKRVLYLFAELTDEDVEWLACVGTVRRLDLGTVLIGEGSMLTSVYFVIDGWLGVTVAGAVDIGRMGSGDIAGEISLVDSGAASATVTATVQSTVLEVPRAVLQERIDRDVAFAARVYRAIAVFLANRLRSSLRRMGYGGTSAVTLAEDEETKDEIDAELLGKVHQAGARFDRIFRSLLAGPRRPVR